MILIKGDIIALSFDQLMPQTHQHPIRGDQGDFRPFWHLVLPWRTGRIAGFKHKLPARRQNSGHGPKGQLDIGIAQQALKRMACHISRLKSSLTLKVLQRALLLLYLLHSNTGPGHGKHRLSRIKPVDSGAKTRNFNRQRTGAKAGIQNATSSPRSG